MSKKTPISILYVCSENICRSPAAEAILKRMAVDAGLDSHIYVDSCGTHCSSNASLPDARMSEEGLHRGYHLNSRSQQFSKDFFLAYDWILVAGSLHLHFLMSQASNDQERAKLALMTRFSLNHKNEEIPDPYREAQGFKIVFDILEESCKETLKFLFPRNDTKAL